MKVKILMLFLFLMFQKNSFSQQGVTAVETFYDFTSRGIAKPDAQNLIDSVFVINARLCVIRDARFCLIYLDQLSITNKTMRNTGNEEKTDSILFDLDKQIAYNFPDKRSYRFNLRSYKFPNPPGMSFTIKKNDTTMVLKKNIDKYSSPSPMISLTPIGIESYSTKGFSFNYISSGESNAVLENIYKKVAGYPLSLDKLPFAF